ncbi:MAG: acetate kinase [Burkholderiaceae bacterium]|nr:acetate kinase [Burkholderiaceae bacterium]
MSTKTGRRATRRAFAAVLAAGSTTLLVPATASGQQAPSEAEVRALAQRIEAGERRLRALEAQLQEERRVLLAIRRAFQQQTRGGDADLAAMAGRGAGDLAQAPVTETPGVTPAAAAPSGPVGEAPPQPAQPAAPARIFEEPTALTPHGKFVLEPSYQFVHSTDNRVALVGFSVIPAITIGLIDVRRVSRDIHTLALTGRYGVTNRFEVEAKVPWVHASSHTQTRALATPSFTDETFDASGSGLGDIELAGRYQFNAFRGDNAVYIGHLRYKSRTGTGVFEVPIDETGLQTELPTGSGFHGLQTGVTFLYPSDPAVFFGGAAYTYNFARDVGHGFGKVRPGSVIDLNAGMGLALNDRASFSIGYQHSIVGSMQQRDPEEVARVLARTGRLQLGTMRFGLGYRLTQKTNLNVSLGIGVTDDTPDFELTVRFPYSL